MPEPKSVGYYYLPELSHDFNATQDNMVQDNMAAFIGFLLRALR